MRSALSRGIALVLVAALGLFVAIVVVSCGGDDEASPTTMTATTTTTTTTETQTETIESEKPTVVSITVRGGVPAGGIVRRSVDKGDRVMLIVTSDVADEVHLHGYDLSRRVEPGRRARIAFRATLAGRFEVELEERHVPIAELTVNS